MKNTIFWFVKIFEYKEHADQFRKGKLFLNRIRYFKKIEEDDYCRCDKEEAIAALFQPKGLSIKFKDFPALNINSEDAISVLSGPVSMKFEHHNDLNIFCMSAIHTGEFECVNGFIEYTEKDEDKLKIQLEIDERCLSFGKFAVVVNANEFIDRVIKYIKTTEYTLQADLVEYYDRETLNGNFKFSEIPFRKSNCFSYQKEYRISVDTNTNGDNPLIMEIGDISDISEKIDSSTINTSLKLNQISCA